MSRQKMDIILNSVLDILKKIKTTPIGNRNEDARINEIADMAVSAAGATVRQTANCTGQPDPRDRIENSSNKLGSDIRQFLSGLFSLCKERSTDPGPSRETRYQFQRFLRNQFAESPTVKLISNIGKIIGQKLGIPLGSYIGQGIGYMVAATTETLVKTCGLGNHHKKLILDTEFSVEMLQRLQEYGVTEQELTLLTRKFVEECHEQNEKFEIKKNRIEVARNEIREKINEI